MRSRRLSLTTRGAFAVGIAPSSAIAGFFLGAEELVLLSIALAALLACGLVQCAHRARKAGTGWRMTMAMPQSETELGKPMRLAVVLSASGRSGSVPTWLEDPGPRWRRVTRHEVPEPLLRTLPNPSSARRLTRITEGETIAVDSEAPTSRRGVFALRGLRLWCFDSVGLFAAVLSVGPSATIAVHPTPVDAGLDDTFLRGEEMPSTTDASPLYGPVRRDNLGDFAGLRPYVPGDRLRLLYWPALARTGDLMVREFEDTAPNRVHVMADIRPELGDEGCEAVLAVAAGVALQVLARGSSLELATSSGERIALGPGIHAASALLRAVAAIDTPRFPASDRARDRAKAPDPEQPGFAATTVAPLVITTADGAETLPGSLGASALVLAT